MDTKQQTSCFTLQTKQSHSKVTGSLAPKFRDSERGIHRTATYYRFLCMLPFFSWHVFYVRTFSTRWHCFLFFLFPRTRQTKDSIRFDSIQFLLSCWLLCWVIVRSPKFHISFVIVNTDTTASHKAYCYGKSCFCMKPMSRTPAYRLQLMCLFSERLEYGALKSRRGTYIDDSIPMRK